MRTLFLVLMAGWLCGGLLGCINVQAPEKVEVNGKADAESWSEYGRSYAEPYTRSADD